MYQDGFSVIPLAADGKVAVGHAAVGVRVRLLGTEFSKTIMDDKRLFHELVAEAKADVLAAAMGRSAALPFRRFVADSDS